MGSRARATDRLLLLGVFLGSLAITQTATYDFENGLGPDWKSNCTMDTGCFKVDKVKNRASGPTVDHTLGSDQGSCAYATGNRFSVLQATVQGPFCFIGWYHQSGVVRRLNAYFRSVQGQKAVTFHAVSPVLGGRWRRVTYSERRTGAIQVSITSYKSEEPQDCAFAVDDLTVDPGHCKPAPQDGSCDFDWGDACGYNVDNHSERWSLHDGMMAEKPGFETVRNDATVGTLYGGYAYYMPEENRPSSGVLTSVMLDPRPKDGCLEFYYFIPWYTASVNTTISLSVFSQDHKGGPIWGPAPRDLFLGRWVPVKASYKASSSYKLRFICSIGGGTHSGFYCAVDGIRVTDCKPQEGSERRFCDFESDWCDWQNIMEGVTAFPWTIQGGTVKSLLQRPSKDHTYGNASGSYLYISNVGRYYHQKAQIINSVSDYDSMTRCVTFWYIVAAGKDSKLRVLAQSLGKTWSDLREVLLWEDGPGAFDTWQMGRIAVSERTRVLMEGVIGSSSTAGYIALDDISIFRNDSCETFPAGAIVGNSVTELLDCTFEDGTLCRWSSPSWKPKDGWLFPGVTAPASKVGPTALPDEAKGSFIYVTKSVMDQSGTVKNLISGSIPRQTSPVCGSFYYHMFSAQGCTLTVTVRTHRGTQRFNDAKPVFSHFGRSVADRWYHVQRTIDFDTDESQVMIKVVSDGQVNFELGIGPIQFAPGACEIASDSQGWCDFEYNTCGWTVDYPWKRQWVGFLVVERKICKSRSGPLDSEYFLELKSSDTSNTSRVTSPDFSGTAESQCLEFWYQRKGKSDGLVQVEVVLDDTSHVLWTQPPYLQDDWMLARVPVQVEQGRNFRVVFRATTGGVLESRLRIDDIALRPGPCSHVAECQFADDLCGYVNGFVDEFRWLVGEGRRFEPTPETSIPWFSSDGIRPITFAYVDLSSPAPRYKYSTLLGGKDGRRLFLMSPIFEVKGSSDTLIIHYVRKGEDIVSMNLSQIALQEDTGKETILQTKELPAGPSWNKFEMLLQPSKYSQIVVNMTRGPGTKGVAAISRIFVRSNGTDDDPASGPSSYGKSSLQCNFENGTSCGWEADAGNITWKLNNPTRRIPPFPRSDRTLQAYRGRFLFVQGSTHNKSVSAILRSPEIPQDWRKELCFSLWVIATKDMSAYVSYPSGKALSMNVLRAQHHWTEYFFYLRFPKNASRVALRIPPLDGLVAIDDIIVRPGRCPDSTKCTFEDYSFCGFSQPKDNAVKWRMRTASHLNMTDHTLGNKMGRVMSLDTTKVDSHHPVSRVYFGQRPPTKASCLKFWWKGYGYPSELSVYRFTHETVLRDPIVSLKTSPLPWWSVRVVPVSSRSNWKVVFEALSSPLVSLRSGVMLDDVEVTDGECPQTNVCSFEEDTCYPWIITNENYTADFQGLQVQRASQFTALPRDHTLPTGDGYYLLLRSSSNHRGRSSLMIREPDRFRCTSFWYYLSQEKIGCNIQAGSTLVPKTAKGWKRFQFDLAEPNGFGEGIHVFTGGDTASFAAIDDVVVDEQPCSAHLKPTEQFNCGNNTFIPVERVCDSLDDCPNGADERNCGSCQFLNDTCGWNLGSSLASPGKLKWWLKRAGEVKGAPQVNHQSYADGYYMLMYGTKHAMVNVTSVALANSPVIRNTGAVCHLNFWYNYATQNHTFNVDFKLLRAEFNIPIWSLDAVSQKPPELIWQEAIVAIGRYTGETKLLFSGMEGPVGYGYFAIDGIRYSRCAIPQKQPKCREGKFQCSSGACVMLSDVCNYVDDCGDLSDEMNCGDYNMGCNFDSSFCEWRPQVSAISKGSVWKREEPHSNLKRSPTRDHTSNGYEGKFLILGAMQSEVDAEIAGPVLKPGECWVTFFFTIVGGCQSVLTLNVRNTSNGPLEQVWKSTGTGFFHFTEGFKLLKRKQPYQVVFRGTHAAAERCFGYIAIDDVSFGKNCVPHNESLPTAPSVPMTPIRPARCPVGHFLCSSSSQCIPPEQVCDFHEDCADRSDEAQCGACDFTVDLCGLTSENPSARFVWNWTSASIVASDPVRRAGMPTRDSSNNKWGSYCAFRLMNPDVPEGYINPLLTPPLGRIAHTCTVSFYAYPGREPSHLLLFGVQWKASTKSSYMRKKKIFAILNGNNTNPTWTKVTAKVGNWPRGAQFYFMTTFIHASIDAIKYSHCHPDEETKAWEATTSVTCNFENDTNCAWFSENTESDLNWVRYSGGNITRTWQPVSLDSRKLGAYMYATNPFWGPQKARIVSKGLSATGKAGRCLSFWYNMWHPNSGTLNVLVRFEDNSTDLVWSRTGPQGKTWHNGRTLLNSNVKHQIVLEAHLIGPTPAMIAVDSIRLVDGSCMNSGLSCDFDAGSCVWTAHNWKITKGESAVVPRRDHSTESGSGGFALLQQTGGRLTSSPMNGHTSLTKCLRFWYYLSGSEREQLVVSRVANFRDETILWNVSAAVVPQNQWLSGSTSVDVATAVVFATFGGSTSGAPQTAVAVDDIRVDDHSCPNAGSCDFENGDLCNWRNAGKNNSVRWYVTNGPTISRTSGLTGGPKGNATNNYLLLDSQDMSPVPQGILESELLPYSPTCCLEFFIYLARGSSSTLVSEIIIPDGTSMNKHELLGVRSRGTWEPIVYQLSDLPPLYKLRITGTLGRNWRRDVALDDIRFIPGKCPHVGNFTEAPTAPPVMPTRPASLTPKPVTTPIGQPQTEPYTSPVPSKARTVRTTITPMSPTSATEALICLSSEFSCRDNENCVPLVLVCDGVEDCPNGLDEKCGGRNQCAPETAFCRSGTPEWCLPRNFLCDGKNDCSDGSDESLCGKCPGNYCRNGGTCSILEGNRSPECQCLPGTSGVRCNVRNIAAPKTLASRAKGSSAASVAVPVVLVLVILCAGIAGFVYYRRKKLLEYASGLNNPTYNAQTDEARIFT